MPAIDFPAAPAVNDEYSFEGRTWRWNGTGWEVKEYPAALLAGTAANPSLYFSGDPNTGLYSPGADQVAISTGGVGKLFVAANGLTTFTDGTVSTLVWPYVGGNVGVYGTTTNHGVMLISNNTERLRITADGKLGIGTSSPAELLQVIGGNIAADNADGRRISFNASDTFAASVTTAVYGLTRGAAGTNTIGLSGFAGLGFYTNNTERLRITSAGNVGIGTSDPKALLDVTGGPVLTKNILYAANQNAAYLIAGTTSYTGATTDWSTYGIQHRFKSDAGGVPRVTIDTNTGELFCVTYAGNVGIGTSSPTSLFNVSGGSVEVTGPTYNYVQVQATSGAQGQLASNGSSAIELRAVTNHPLIFYTNNTERARLDASGRLLVGTSTAYSTDGNAGFATLHINGLGAAYYRYTAVGNGPIQSFGLSRSGTTGTNTVVAAEDNLGIIQFTGADGTGFILAADIQCRVDGTPGLNDMPGRLVFRTTADGASSPTERMRIDNAGNTTLTSAASTAPFIAKISTSEVVRIDSSGRLLVGTSTATNNNRLAQKLSIVNTGDNTYGGMSMTSYVGTTSTDRGSILDFQRSRGTTDGSLTAVIDNDALGYVLFRGADGTNFVDAAQIRVQVDGTPGTNDMPGRIVLSTTLNGASSPTEQWRITNGGTVVYNQPDPAAVNTTATLTVANLTAKIITSTTAAAVTMTLPTGTDMDAGFSGLYTNMAFEWSVINTGATNAVTVQGGTGHTVVGSGTVAASNSGRFVSRRTAATTWVTYRLSS